MKRLTQLMFLLLFGFVYGQEANTLKIGVVLPFTSQISEYSKDALAGMNLAIHDYEDANKIQKNYVQLIIKDNELSQVKTKEVFNDLITNNHINIFIGPLSSKCALVVSEDFKDENILDITPTATLQDVTDVSNNVFRVCYTDSYQGVILADFAYHNLKNKKAVILTNISNDLSKTASSFFTEEFKNQGGTIVKNYYYDGISGINDICQNIKNFDADVIFLPDSDELSYKTMLNLRKSGVNIPFLGIDEWENIPDDNLDDIGECYYTVQYCTNPANNRVKELEERYNSFKKSTPSLVSV